MSRITRRSFNSALIGAGAALTTRPLHASAESLKSDRSLGAIAAEKGILFGASFAVHELDASYGEQYARIYQTDARILTSELEFKMSELRPTADKLDFAESDRLVDFAIKRNMKVRAHTLIWNDDLPDWIKMLTPDAAAQLLNVHITTVMERYKGRVDIWDVVNEPIGPWDKNPGNLRSGVYYTALGENYISTAFKKAREISPASTLVLNEAQTETNDDFGKTFRDSLLALLLRLKDDGAPIDAVGIQSHLRTAAPYDFAAFAAYLNEIAELGYAIHVTELDVNDTGTNGPVSKRDAAVADLYESYLNAVLKLPAVKVVQLWQLSDKTTWMQDPETAARMKIRPKARPLLYDDAFRKKPAWDAVARALSDAPAR